MAAIPLRFPAALALPLFLLGASPAAETAETDWPGWRGPQGNAIAAGDTLPLRWDRRSGIAWSARIPGEGNSSPIVKEGRVFVTSAEADGRRRSVHCLDRTSGEITWTRSIEDDSPEVSSSATGHAASTPAADGRCVVALFGNAGAVAYSVDGVLLWRTRLGKFDTELGLAASPVIDGDRVILVCDHDGDRFTSFDSFLVALSLGTGKEIWKQARPETFRSWSTPVLVPVSGGAELVVAAQEEARGYDPAGGALLWRIRGLTAWVAPSPVFGDGLIVVASGANGPVLAVQPGGRGDVTASHIRWKLERESPTVSSPLLYQGRLYLIQENGRLACFRSETCERLFEQRLTGKFTASPVAGAGLVYYTNEEGTTEVLRAGDAFESLARNELGEYTAASPAVAGGRIYLRTERQLFCIAGDREPRPAERRSIVERAVEYLASETPRWPRENKCFSCHNNGDAARALIAAGQASLAVPKDSLTTTVEWLRAPERWIEKPNDETLRHPDLAPLQFAAALLLAAESGALTDRAALERAADLIARSQRADGSWGEASESGVGSPTSYSPHLATYFGRSLLRAVETPARGEAARRAEAWLLARKPRNVHQASVLLLASARGRGFPGEPRISESLACLASGRSADGGWGPYENSPSEVFDTALVLLALARRKSEMPAGDAAGEASKGAAGRIDEWIRGGREYLARTQETDGHWRETTRPPGAESYAQRISTTAWAVLALLATR